MAANGDLLPVANPTTAYWLAKPHHLASYRSSDTVPKQCDIAIIGTGMAGVATAYHLLSRAKPENRPKIVLFEARQVCSGATGRNGMLLVAKFLLYLFAY
jgi:ribulose 1,5-bisphosphate synthetase/thiazole synthase